MLQTEVVEKNKTHFMSSNFFYRKSCRLLDNVEKYGGGRHSTNDIIWRKNDKICMLNN